MAFCGKCGSQLHDNATFCANCGTPTSAAATPPPQQAGGIPVSAQPVMTQPMYMHAAPPPPPSDSFGALFDVTFKGSAGMPLVKVLFVLGIIVAAGVAVLIVYVSQNNPSVIDPTAAIILAPILFLLYVMQTRLMMEVFVAIFRMEKHLSEIIQQGRRQQ